MPRTRTTPESEWMPREALPPDAIVRLDHAGEWVAWNRDMKRAVATGPDREAVRAAAIAAGIVRPICEWVPPVPIRPVDDVGRGSPTRATRSRTRIPWVWHKSSSLLTVFVSDRETIMQKNLQGRLDTTTKSLATLCDEIRKGEVKIPQFQRKYVWKDSQAIDLLDSIASNYPVGSLLIWTTKHKMHVERNIGDFELPATDDVDPTDYVLDGQQRLTVIYSCLGAQVQDGGFAAAYDLEKEVFVKLPKASYLHIFPLRRLYDFTAMLNFRTALLTHPQGNLLNQRFDALAGTLTNYRIPVVTLKDLTVDEVCPIFERINSSGTKLSTFDLLAATIWTKDFDLNEQAEKIQTALIPKGFEDIEGGTVLKCLSAIQHRGVKRDQVFSLDKLTKPQMTQLVDATKVAILKAVDLLSTEFQIVSVHELFMRLG